MMSAVFCRHIRSTWFAPLALILIVAAAPARAQQTSPGVRAGGDQQSRKHKEPRTDKPNQRPPRPERDNPLPGLHMFRPLPEDQGPLTPEERLEIVNFLREKAPDLYDSLKHLRRENAEAFVEQVEKAAPHLRRLRRIYTQNPELGESIVQHTRNMRKIHRARQALANEPRDPQSRRRLERMLRNAMAENFDIEIAVLEDQQREYETRRDELVRAMFDRVKAPEADLTNEPPPVLHILERLTNDPPELEAQRLNDELWLICSERVDFEIDAVSRRLNQMRDNREAEIDRRVEHITRPRDPEREAPDRDRRRHGRP